MLSAADNELLARVGPGTAMGNLMRQYWMPAMRSDELPSPDCPPLRVRLLGEDLIAFRTTSGDSRPDAERLPAPRRLDVLRPQRRRRPALRLPRLEVRRRRQLRRHAVGAGRVQLQDQGARHAPTPRTSAAASSGPTWARARRRRRCPTSKPTCSTTARRAIYDALPRVQLDAGLRGRDGHRPRGLPALRRRRSVEDMRARHLRLLPVHASAPRKFAVIDTDFGTSYGAYRPAEDDTYYWRIAHILFPFYAMIPGRHAGPGHAHRRLRADGRRAHDALGDLASATARRSPAAAHGCRGSAAPAGAAGGRRRRIRTCPTTTDWLRPLPHRRRTWRTTT